MIDRNGSRNNTDPAHSAAQAASEWADLRILKQRFADGAVDWFVDLVHSVVEVYIEPSGPTESLDYAKMERVDTDGTLILALEGREIGRIAVRDVLP